MPLANIDFRETISIKDPIKKGRYINSWYILLAEIYDVSRSEIEQREKKRLKALLVASIAVYLLIGSASLLVTETPPLLYGISLFGLIGLLLVIIPAVTLIFKRIYSYMVGTNEIPTQFSLLLLGLQLGSLPPLFTETPPLIYGISLISIFSFILGFVPTVFLFLKILFSKVDNKNPISKSLIVVAVIADFSIFPYIFNRIYPLRKLLIGEEIVLLVATLMAVRLILKYLSSQFSGADIGVPLSVSILIGGILVA